MIAIQRIKINLELALEAEPSSDPRSAVQFEPPAYKLWAEPRAIPDEEGKQYDREMAEIVWQEIMLESLRTYYGELGFPPYETLSNYTSQDPAAMAHWYRKLESTLKHYTHTYFWRLKDEKRFGDGMYIASLYHQGRKASDWMLWDYGRFLEVRFHPSAGHDADGLVENLFKPMHRHLVRGGFPSLEGLPIEVSYALQQAGPRSRPLHEFFTDVGIPLDPSHESSPG